MRLKKTKLIRDKLVKGKHFPGLTRRPVRTLAEKAALLQLKLFEEAAELANKPTDVEEYADVLAVLQELAHVFRIPWQDVLDAQRAKDEEKGGFRNGVVMIVEENDENRN